ncbi:MAG: ATP-binding cassette domain-containing protein [Magnetococcales bacterium]|nr:ATP-binding cassette domain-containing protein [Magnetococcales bacterium]
MPKDIRGLPEGAGNVGTITVLGITSLVINLLGLMVPLVLMQVFNRIIPNQAVDTLSLLVMGVLIALAVEGILRTLRAYIISWIGARFTHKGSCRILRRLLFAEPRVFERVDGAKYLEQMGAINTLGDQYSGQGMLAIFDFPFLLLFLFMIYQIGGVLVLIPLISLTLIGLFSMMTGSKLRKTLDTDIELSERRFSFITETLSRIHSVKALAMESLMLRRYEMLQQPNIRQTYDIIAWGGTIPVFSAFTSQATTALVIGFGAIQVINSDLTTGGLAACVMLSGRSLQPLQALVGGWTRLQSTKLAKRQVETLFAIPQRPIHQKTEEEDVVMGALDLQNISCTFEGDLTILDKLSLSVEPGECVGLIGESGEGKTTLLKLISGSVAPTGGKVLIDGYDRSELPPHMHASIGYIPQKGTLFNATILENLTMFDPSRTEDALEIAEKLGLDDMVSRTPKGYHTPVGEGVSDTLPAGVIQRITITRILAMKPRIVLFDEANIAIDSEGDIMLRNYLDELKGSCTILLVSQRPSLLRITDRAVQFHQGRLKNLDHFMDALRPPPPKPGEEREPVTEAPTLAAKQIVATDEVLEESPKEEDRPEFGSRSWQQYLEQMPDQNPATWCLKGLLEGFHWHGTARQLAEAIPHMLSNLDLTGLCNVMANLSFSFQTERGKITDVDNRLTPFLFVFENGHSVVVQKVKSHGEMEITDSKDGERHTVKLTGVGDAYFFIPDQDERTVKRSWLKMQLGLFRSLVGNIMAITLVAGIMTMSIPVYVMIIYDRVIPSGSVSTGMVMLLGAILALIVDAVLRIRRAHMLAYIGAKVERSLGGAILGKIMSMPPNLTEQVSIGDQVSRVKSLEIIREMMTGPLALLFYDIPSTLLFLVLLMVINPGVVVMMVALIVILTLFGMALLPVIRYRSMVSSKLHSQKQIFLTETLSRIQTIQMTHAEETWFERYREISGKATLAESRLNMISSQLTTLAKMVTMAAAIGIMSITARAVMAGELGMGAVVASMLMTWRILSPIQTAFLGIVRMVSVFNSTAQLDRLMDIRGERNISKDAITQQKFVGEVAFARVSFRYVNDADPALVGMSFRIPAGSVVTIIGANGSGKSTLMKLIMGLYSPQAGSVLIDNNDIRQLSPIELRHAISYLPQKCDIFFGTVAQNLRLANPEASDEELEEAARQSGMLEEIQDLPRGFNTRLQDSGGEQLSAGFRQRLSLTRTLLKRSPITLFDEPSNNMDSKSETLFLETINRMRGKSTVFIVTHRPSHLKMADLVLYLDRGYLKAIGPPDEINKMLPKTFV